MPSQRYQLNAASDYRGSHQSRAFLGCQYYRGRTPTRWRRTILPAPAIFIRPVADRVATNAGQGEIAEGAEVLSVGALFVHSEKPVLAAAQAAWIGEVDRIVVDICIDVHPVAIAD